MTLNADQGRDPVAPDDASPSADMVKLQVMIRPDHLALLRGFAEREGATVEALASLWLEEKLDEAVRYSRSLPIKGEPGRGE